MLPDDSAYDVIMFGTFAAWRLGTLQARALPLARALRRRGLRVALVTFPWDMPSEAGVRDELDGVSLINTRGARLAAAPALVRETVVWAARQRAVAYVFKPKGFGGLVGRALLGRLPVVVDSDDWEGDGGWNGVGGYGPAQRRLFDWQERDLLRRADGVTAASSLLMARARALRRDRVDGDHVWRLPNGLEDAWRERLAMASRQTSRVDEPVTIALYSRFAEFAADWLPRFIAALDAAAPLPVRLRLIGDAPPIDARPLVAIERLGYVERDALPRLLGSATLAVHPFRDALIARSKGSVKLLELMAAGCPVVVSAVGDIRGTLGAAGVALPGDDPRAFAAETTRLLEAPEQLRAMRAVGPSRVARHYRIDTFADTLMKVYAACGAPWVDRAGLAG